MLSFVSSAYLNSLSFEERMRVLYTHVPLGYHPETHDQLIFPQTFLSPMRQQTDAAKRRADLPPLFINCGSRSIVLLRCGTFVLICALL